MAQWLSEWSRPFAATAPGCAAAARSFRRVRRAYVQQALGVGAVIFEAHVQVGGYDPRDDLLDPVWGMLAEAGAPVVAHYGYGPVPGVHTGAAAFGEVLVRHPWVTSAIARAGAPKFAEHLNLDRRYPSVHLDTAMAATPYTKEFSRFDRALIPLCADLEDSVVLGTDFPNILDA